MSTPPFIDIPEGVAHLGSDRAPAPLLLASPDGQAPAAPRGNVLLVPGFTGSKEDFIAVLLPLARRGWRVAAMDLPGQNGHRPLGARDTHTEEALATAVADVARWLGPPVHLVGHSLGGLITRNLVLRDPDMLASWTALCSGPAAVGRAQHDLLRELRDALAKIPMAQIWAMKEALDRSGEGWTPRSEQVQQFLTERFLSNDPAALADFAGILMTSPDLREDLRTIIARSGLHGAVITGGTDMTWPVDEQRNFAHDIGLPWRLLEGIGHSPAASDPEITAEVLDSVFAGPDDRRISRSQV